MGVTVRCAIAERDAVGDALKDGGLGGYAGDVWEDPQPALQYRPWRTMPRHAMTPHVSGISLDG